MSQNMGQQDSAIGAFTGLVILFVVLSMLFIVTSPKESTEPSGDEVVAIIPTETQIPPTEIPTEAPTQIAEQESATLDPELIAMGETLFIAGCSGCHGVDGRGIQGVGKDLVDGEFPRTASDEELATLIIMGRPVWDPANTTSIDMPPRGGNPALSNDDIDIIIVYLRSLQN